MKMHRKTSRQPPTFLIDSPTCTRVGFDREKAWECSLIPNKGRNGWVHQSRKITSRSYKQSVREVVVLCHMKSQSPRGSGQIWSTLFIALCPFQLPQIIPELDEIAHVSIWKKTSGWPIFWTWCFHIYPYKAPWNRKLVLPNREFWNICSKHRSVYEFIKCMVFFLFTIYWWMYRFSHAYAILHKPFIASQFLQLYRPCACQFWCTD